MLKKKLTLFVLPLVATLSLHANDPMNDPFFQDPFGDDIFKEMMQMQQHMDEMFNQMHQRMQQRSTRLVSPLGTYKIAGQEQFVDKGDHFEYISNIPENKENQIDIHVQDGVMSINAKIIEKQENKTANGYSSSRSMRMYQQSIPIPSNADESNMTANYKDGKLVISMTKKAEKKSTPNITIHKPSTTSKVEKQESNSTQKVNETKEHNSSKNNITIHSDTPSMS